MSKHFSDWQKISLQRSAYEDWTASADWHTRRKACRWPACDLRDRSRTEVWRLLGRRPARAIWPE